MIIQRFIAIRMLFILFVLQLITIGIGIGSGSGSGTTSDTGTDTSASVGVVAQLPIDIMNQLSTALISMIISVSMRSYLYTIEQ